MRFSRAPGRRVERYGNGDDCDDAGRQVITFRIKTKVIVDGGSGGARDGCSPMRAHSCRLLSSALTRVRAPAASIKRFTNRPPLSGRVAWHDVTADGAKVVLSGFDGRICVCVFFSPCFTLTGISSVTRSCCAWTESACTSDESLFNVNTHIIDRHTHKFMIESAPFYSA